MINTYTQRKKKFNKQEKMSKTTKDTLPNIFPMDEMTVPDKSEYRIESLVQEKGKNIKMIFK